MLPDLKLYWHHVDHLDVPDARKTELINIVYSAMQSFVDRAHRDDPVQLAMTTKDEKRALPAYDVVDLAKGEYSEFPLSKTFNDKKGEQNE